MGLYHCILLSWQNIDQNHFLFIVIEIKTNISIVSITSSIIFDLFYYLSTSYTQQNNNAIKNSLVCENHLVFQG